MSGIIKSSDEAAMVARVRSAPGGRQPAEPDPPHEQVISMEVLSLRRELETLSRRLEERDGEIERLKIDVGRAFREGEAEGRKTGLKEGEERRVEALALLESGIQEAQRRFSDELTSLEGLAAALANEGLSKVLGEPAYRAELVRGTIQHHLKAIEAKSVVRIEVSRDDFPEPAQLDQFVDSIGLAGTDFQSSAELDAGDCRIKLTLGALDIGIDQQRTRLETALTDLAALEPAT